MKRNSVGFQLFNSSLKLPVVVSICLGIGMLAGCSNSQPSSLVGKWRINDAESVSQKVGGGEEEQPAKMTVEFMSTGKLVTTTKMGSIDSTKNGSWQIVELAPDRSWVKIQCTLQMQTTDHKIDLSNEDSIKWVPPNMAGTTGKIEFVRVN